MFARGRLSIAIVVGGMLLADAVLFHEAAVAQPMPLTGDYFSFSGEMGEMGEPKKGDIKISFHYTGKLAAYLYEKLGASAQNQYCADNGFKSRQRGFLWCTKAASGGKTECWYGLSLTTGRPTAGMIC